jgi:hypothetical protein
MGKFWKFIKLFGKHMLLSHIGRVGLSFVWIIIFLSIDSITLNSEWPFWVSMIGVLHLLIIAIVLMINNMFIKPIRDKNKRKELEEKKQSDK